MSTENTENSPETNDDQAAAPGPSEAPEETQEATEDGDLAKVRKEAAGHRVRAKQAEERAEAAEARLEAVLAHVVGEVAGRSGVSAEALSAAEVDRGKWFTDDGGLDLDQMKADVAQVRERFGLPRLGISPHAGTGGERQTGVTWSSALNR